MSSKQTRLYKDKMNTDKLKKFLNNPYWAPLVHPVRNVALITVRPIEKFIENVVAGWDRHKYYGGTRIGNVLRELTREFGGTELLGTGGFALGGLCAAGASGFGLYTAMGGASTFLQWAGVVTAGIAGGSIGAVAGPFVLAGIVAAGAAIVGCVLGIVPGVITGTVKAVKHHIQQKNAPKVAAATAAVAAVAPAQPTVNEKVSAIVNDFMTLPEKSREALFKELERISGDPSRHPAEKMVTAIQNMPDAERVAVIEKLQDRLSVDFGTVAAKRARAAQEDEMEVYKSPIRLKNKAPATTGG